MGERHGTVWWSELMTREPAAARDFFAKICGWKYEDMPMGEGTYHVAQANGRPVAGIMDMAGIAGLEDVPPHWMTYLAVDDVDAALEAVRASAGRVMREPFDVPDVGRIAIVSDPGGAAVGIMTPVDEAG